jgi:hypothetical protein
LSSPIIWLAPEEFSVLDGYFSLTICSYVLASYARFLWDAEEEEEEEEDEEERHETEYSHASTSKLFQGAPHHSPLTAAS